MADHVMARADHADADIEMLAVLLSEALAIFDHTTGAHVKRVNEYSFVLAGLIGLPEPVCEEIRYSAALHDIGKLRVPHALLVSPDAYGPEEKAAMDRHPVYGHELLSRSPRFALAAEIALCHHERWDGSGYPRGLKGEDIPMPARIVQFADIYDALRDARHYKKAMDHASACRVIFEGDERIDPVRHFDPRLLDVLRDHHLRFEEIWDRFQV